jgi:hypothetical protein
MAQGLLPRLLLGLVLAAVLTFVLHIWVGRDPNSQPPVSVSPIPPGGDTVPAAGEAAGKATVTPTVLDTLHGEALLVYLGQRREKLPAGAAPVLAIEPGGAIRLAVPPPLSDRPGREIWAKMGILLPKERLVHLTPPERSSLLRIWAAVAPEGWLRERQIVATDLDFRPEELTPLLKRQRRWQ